MPFITPPSREEKFSEPAEAIDRLLTIEEVAEMLRISVPSVWRGVAKGRIPKPIKLGALSRWPRSEIVAVIEAAKAARGAI